jgi:hypothetical protein
MRARCRVWRQALSRTSVMLVGLVTWFAAAVGLSQVDVGPDWFDSARYEHMDAVLMATGVAVVAVLLAALVALHRGAGRT